MAAMRRQLEVAECLLSLGLRPNPKSAQGWTPLNEAVCLKDRAMVQPGRDCRCCWECMRLAQHVMSTPVKECLLSPPAAWGILQSESSTV